MNLIKIKGIHDKSIFINSDNITFITCETIENDDYTVIHLTDKAEIYTKQTVKEIVELIRKGE